MYEEKAKGTAVVDAVIRRIDSSSIFPNDHGLLRKIAWVESKFGEHSDTFRMGDNGVGIWQIDLKGLTATKDTASHPKLKQKHDAIKKEFAIVWNSVKTIDLHTPIYCGLAARLLLSNVKEAIPIKDDKQAAYWKKHYNSFMGDGSRNKFLSDIQRIPPMASVEDDTCEIITNDYSPKSSNQQGKAEQVVSRDLIYYTIRDCRYTYNQ